MKKNDMRQKTVSEKSWWVRFLVRIGSSKTE